MTGNPSNSDPGMRDWAEYGWRPRRALLVPTEVYHGPQSTGICENKQGCAYGFIEFEISDSMISTAFCQPLAEGLLRQTLPSLLQGGIPLDTRADPADCGAGFSLGCGEGRQLLTPGSWLCGFLRSVLIISIRKISN